MQAAYDEDDKTRNIQENETDYHDTLFVESIDERKPSTENNEPQSQDEEVSDEAETITSDVEEFSVKKSTNHKVFHKANNPDAQKRLTRSADLKKTDTIAPKLPILTKVNIQNVPKGITITKTKKNVSKPIAGSAKKGETETSSKKTTPNSSPGGIKKFALIKVPAAEAKESPPKNASADGSKKMEVQKVRLTKAQVAAMAKEGKIAVKDGQVFLRNGPNKNAK